MSVNNQTAQTFVENMQRMTDAAIGKAKYDKTITATIVKCENPDVGKYRVKYKENFFPAYSLDTSTTYKNGTSVFVQVPEGDFSQTKTILGLSKSRDRENTLIASKVDNLDDHYYELSYTKLVKISDRPPITFDNIAQGEFKIYPEYKNNIKELGFTNNGNVASFIEAYKAATEIFTNDTDRVDLKMSLKLKSDIKNPKEGFQYGFKIYFKAGQNIISTIDVNSTQNFTGSPFNYFQNSNQTIYIQGSVDKTDFGKVSLTSDITDIEVYFYWTKEGAEPDSFVTLTDFSLSFAAYSANVNDNMTSLLIYASKTALKQNEEAAIYPYFKWGGQLQNNYDIKWYTTSSLSSGQSGNPWRENDKAIPRLFKWSDLLDGERWVYATVQPGGPSTTPYRSNILKFSSDDGSGKKIKTFELKYKQYISAADLISNPPKTSKDVITINSKAMRNQTYAFGVWCNATKSFVKTGDNSPFHEGRTLSMGWQCADMNATAPPTEVAAGSPYVTFGLNQPVADSRIGCAIYETWTETVEGEEVVKKELISEPYVTFEIATLPDVLSTNMSVLPSIVNVKYEYGGDFPTFESVQVGAETYFDEESKTITIKAAYRQQGEIENILGYYWYYSGETFTVDGQNKEDRVSEKGNFTTYEKQNFMGYYRFVDTGADIADGSSIVVKINSTWSRDKDALTVIAVKSTATIGSDTSITIPFNYRTEYEPSTRSYDKTVPIPQTAQGTGTSISSIETLYYANNQFYRNKYNWTQPVPLSSDSPWFIMDADSYTFDLLEQIGSSNTYTYFTIDNNDTPPTFDWIEDFDISEIRDVITASPIGEPIDKNDSTYTPHLLSSLMRNKTWKTVINDNNEQTTVFDGEGITPIAFINVIDGSKFRPYWPYKNVQSFFINDNGLITKTDRDTNEITIASQGMAIPEGCKFIWQIHQDLYNTIKQQYEHTPLFKININGNIYTEGTETNSNTIKLQIVKGTNAAAYECKTVGIAVSCVIKYMSKIIAYCYLPLKCYTSIDDFDGSHIYSDAGGQGNVFRDITDADGKIKGYIFTQQMAAGEYTTTDRDGHPSGWSGVVAGVIGDADSTGKVETGNFYGLRGYHQGTVSYELGTDDGHVILGEAGKGRIEITPGAEAAITSETFNDTTNPGGLKISFANQPYIKYGNGNFAVDSDGILTAQGATINGSFKTIYEDHWDESNPFTHEGDQETIFKTGNSKSFNEDSGAALGFLLQTKKITQGQSRSDTIEVGKASDNPDNPGYVIGNASGTIQYVKSRIAPDSFSFGKYLGNYDSLTQEVSEEGLIDGIMYDFTNGLFISGTIRAKKGIIAGWTITDDSIVSPSGGLKLMSNGDIIGYSPVNDNNVDQRAEGQNYDFGDYLHIQRDNVAWEVPEQELIQSYNGYIFPPLLINMNLKKYELVTQVQHKRMQL